MYFKEQKAETGKGENTGKLRDKLEAPQEENGKRASSPPKAAIAHTTPWISKRPLVSGFPVSEKVEK